MLKSILYRKLSAHPAVLILDNISSGFSLQVRQEIFEILKEASRKGVGILFIFSDLVECFGFCDRILIPGIAHREYMAFDPGETDLEHVIPLIQI